MLKALKRINMYENGESPVLAHHIQKLEHIHKRERKKAYKSRILTRGKLTSRSES